MRSRSDRLARALNAQRTAFRAFLIARVGSEAEVEDILQNGLVKAVQRAGELRDDDKLTPWFYRLLRNAIVDHYRSKVAIRRRDDLLGTSLAVLEEDIAGAPPGWEAKLCTCLGSVVDTLKPLHAELLRRVDLNAGRSQGTRSHGEQRQRHPAPCPSGSPYEAAGILRRLCRLCVSRLPLRPRPREEQPGVRFRCLPRQQG